MQLFKIIFKIQRCKKLKIRLESIIKKREIKAENKKWYKNNLHKQGLQWEVQEVFILSLGPTIYGSTPYTT